MKNYIQFSKNLNFFLNKIYEKILLLLFIN